MGIDDFLRQVEEDEREDRLEIQTHATPIDYARTRSIRPQRVYYYLRNGKLTSTTCACGRRVINIEEADALLGFNQPSNDFEERYSDGDLEE